MLGLELELRAGLGAPWAEGRLCLGEGQSNGRGLGLEMICEAHAFAIVGAKAQELQCYHARKILQRATGLG